MSSASATSVAGTLTVEEVARIRGVTTETVRDWLTKGITIRAGNKKRRVALYGERVGRRWRINPSDLDMFVSVVVASTKSPFSIRSPSESAASFRDRADREEAALKHELSTT